MFKMFNSKRELLVIQKDLIKPISFIKSLLLFAFTSAMMVCGIYFVMPILMSNGISTIQSYLIGFYTPLAFMFFLSIYLYKKEGYNITKDEFVSRFNFKKLDKKTVLMSIAITLGTLVSYFGLGFTGKILASLPLLSPPDFFPPEINPNKVLVTGQMFGEVLKGQWWIPIAYFIGWFFNIFGEEMLWRGYLFPRQEKVYGNKTWIVHGIMWGFWHVFWKWQLLYLIPTALVISYGMYKTKNIWVGIIAHGFANFLVLIMIIKEVIG